MKQKVYFIVLSALIFVLNFTAFINLTLNNNAILRYWSDFRGDIIYIAILLSMVVLAITLTLSIYFFVFKGKIIVSHCNMAFSVLVLAFFQIMLLWPPYFQNNNLSMIIQIICGIVLGGFYLIGFFTLQKAEASRNIFHLIYVIIFSVVLVFSDLINISRSYDGYIYCSFSMVNISWITLGALIIGIAYYLLYCMGKSSKICTVGVILIDGILTVLSIFLKFFNIYSEDGAIHLFVGILLAYLILVAFVFCLLLKNEDSNILGKNETPAPLKELENLQKLHEAGVLTDEEYQTQKEKVLGGK